MNEINFVKNIDNLGRIVIPMDIRRKMQINTGDVLSITCNDRNILLTKYSSLSNNSKVMDIVRTIVDLFGLQVILVDRDNVIYSNVVGNVKLSSEFKDSMNLVKNNVFGMLKFQGNIIEDVYNMVPIITNEGVIGSIICIGKSEYLFRMCEMISKVISIELNIT